MTTMYRCDVCRSIYSDKRVARTCERWQPPPQQFQPGDDVLVIVRYGAPQPGKIVSATLVRNPIFDYTPDPDSAQMLKIMASGERHTHEYLYKLGTEYQTGKEHWTDSVFDNVLIKA